ncbi:MAG: signal peptidase II [Chloroflexota bacterium]|nr:signal peptidase II [Chloroflexota bacterium]
MATETLPLTPTARLRAALPLLALAAAVVALDQASKAWIVATIGRGQADHTRDLLPGWLVLLYTENTGAAFGLLRDGSWVLGLIALAVAGGILIAAPRLQAAATTGWLGRALQISLGLVLGGALGNLLDRLTRGFVVDFIRVPVAEITLGTTVYRFPNFNVADSAITVGIALLVLYMLSSGERAPAHA